jgi:hypothetical protein
MFKINKHIRSIYIFRSICFNLDRNFEIFIIIELLGAHHIFHVGRIRVKHIFTCQRGIIQGVSVGIVNILGGGSMDYSD